MTPALKELERLNALVKRAKTLRNELDDSNARLDQKCVTAMYEMEQAILSLIAELEQAKKDAENIRKEINEQPIRSFLAPAYANNDLAATGRNDVLYAQAVDLIKKHGKYSISLVQRHLKIGYNRAVWMVEHAEQDAAIAKEQS